MGVAVNPNAMLRFSGLGQPASFSWCGWRRLDSDTGTFQALTHIGPTSGTSAFVLATDEDLQVVLFGNPSFATVATGPTMTLGEWFFLAVTTIEDDIPGNVTLWWRHESETELSSAVGDFEGAYGAARINIGGRNDNLFPGDISAAYDRFFASATLSEAQLLAESQSPTAVLTAFADWPLPDASSLGDISGNGRDLTLVANSGSIASTGNPALTAGPNTGTATFGLDLLLSAAGETAHRGAAALSLDLALDAAAATAHRGTAGFDLAAELAATGTRASGGTASLALDLALTAAGPSPAHQGTVDFPLLLTLAAAAGVDDVQVTAGPLRTRIRAGLLSSRVAASTLRSRP